MEPPSEESSVNLVDSEAFPDAVQEFNSATMTTQGIYNLHIILLIEKAFLDTFFIPVYLEQTDYKLLYMYYMGKYLLEQPQSRLSPSCVFLCVSFVPSERRDGESLDDFIM